MYISMVGLAAARFSFSLLYIVNNNHDNIVIMLIFVGKLDYFLLSFCCHMYCELNQLSTFFLLFCIHIVS